MESETGTPITTLQLTWPSVAALPQDPAAEREVVGRTSGTRTPAKAEFVEDVEVFDNAGLTASTDMPVARRPNAW